MTSDCAFHGATGPTELPKNSLGLMRSGQWRLDGVQTLIREAAYNNGEHWPNVQAQGSCRVSKQPLFVEALETGLGPSIQILDPSECMLDKVRCCSGRCEDWLFHQSAFWTRNVGQKKTCYPTVCARMVPNPWSCTSCSHRSVFHKRFSNHKSYLDTRNTFGLDQDQGMHE